MKTRVANSDITYRLTGEGETTLIITQALGLTSAEWWLIQEKLSANAQVLTWDRAGYGDSSPAATPRIAANIAAEALELMGAVAPDGPLVLVGHSRAPVSRFSIRIAHPNCCGG